MVTWAATSGALVGFGLRYGDAAGPFARFGAGMLAAAGVPRPSSALAVVVGLAGHVVWMSAWSVGYAAIATSLRAIPAFVVALLLSLAAMVISGWWLPAALGAVRSAMLAPMQLALILTVMAASMVMSRTVASAR